MTNTKQRQSLTLPDSGDSDWKKADKRFLWNYHMGSSLLNLANSGDRSKVAPFLVLLIHGGVYIHRCSINGVRIFIKISNFHFNQGLLNYMDRTLRALAKFESSKPGLIYSWDPNYTPGVYFLDHKFLSSKNSG